MAQQSVFSGNQWTTASGSSWAVVIEPDFVNSVAELANHIALSSQEARTKSENLVEKAQAESGAESQSSNKGRKEVVSEIIVVVREGGLNQGAEARDIEGFVNLASALVKTLFKDEQGQVEDLLVKLAQGCAKASSNESNAIVTARYNALSALFNALPESVTYQTRTSILLSLFQLAVQKDDLSILTSALEALPTWVSKEWSISDSNTQDSIISQFVNVLEGVNTENKEEVSDLIRKLLFAYTTKSSSEELKEKLLFYTLANTSNIHDIDLESLPSTTSNSTLNTLKDIFLSGTVSDLESFFGSNSSDNLIAKMDKDKLKEKLQFIILADYCSDNVGNDITYDQVADVLGLKNEGDDEEERAMQVEIWVIATIRVKLLKARLHQPTSTISILQASPRKFTSKQWELLQSRLENWKSSLSNIQDTVGRALGGGGGGNTSERNTGGRQLSHYGQQQRDSRNAADAQDIVNAHAEKGQQQPETQQPVVEVA